MWPLNSILVGVMLVVMGLFHMPIPMQILILVALLAGRDRQ